MRAKPSATLACAALFAVMAAILAATGSAAAQADFPAHVVKLIVP